MGMPNLAERHWSPAAVRALPEDGNRYECIDGQLLVSPSPRAVHQDVLMQFIGALSAFVQEESLGHLLASPADLEFIHGSLVQPDLFVAVPRSPARRVRQWTDVERLRLAVEVLSPSTARYDRGFKRLFYQRAGVDEYWIVDPDARLLERWRPDDARPEVVRERFLWTPSESTRSLEIDVSGILATVLDT